VPLLLPVVVVVISGLLCEWRPIAALRRAPLEGGLVVGARIAFLLTLWVCLQHSRMRRWRC
jgi:hypothetical protein